MMLTGRNQTQWGSVPAIPLSDFLLGGQGALFSVAVDDHEPWRSFAARMLQKKPELQLISEASDGLEAIQKAEGLRPDLILLDIGLPTVNGIEVARRILQYAPKRKILFVSEQKSSDIVEAALGMGARGYVVKSRAAIDLLAAVEAVLRGEQFVSASLIGPTPVRHEHNHIEPVSRQHVEHHEIKFHADQAGLTNDFVQFTQAALNNGSAVVIIATESLRTSVFQRVRTDGVDLGASAARYFSVDISDPLSRFTLDEAVKSARHEGLHVAVG